MDTAIATSEIAAFNKMAAQAEKAGKATLLCVWKAGEIAKKTKASLEHGEWTEFVRTYYDVDQTTVNRWVRFHNAVPESKLGTVPSLTEGLKLLDAPEKPKNKAKTDEEPVRTDSDSGQERDPEASGEDTEDLGDSLEDDFLDDADADRWEEEDEDFLEEDTPEEQAKRAKNLAGQYRDKLVRAIDDYHRIIPNPEERDRLVKAVQGVSLW